jgi:hypothetical protein
MPPQHDDPFNYVELRRAKPCLDCEVIFDGPRCPACTSETFVPVKRWIRPTERVPAPPPAPPPALPAASKSRRLLKGSLYVGLGAYGVWKMLFEPSQRRRRKPTAAEGPPESPG